MKSILLLYIESIRLVDVRPDIRATKLNDRHQQAKIDKQKKIDQRLQSNSMRVCVLQLASNTSDSYVILQDLNPTLTIDTIA